MENLYTLAISTSLSEISVALNNLTMVQIQAIAKVFETLDRVKHFEVDAEVVWLHLKGE